MKVETLKEVEAEVKRFLKKLEAAKKRLNEYGDTYGSGTKETGAVRRAALDLKVELTKITQSKY